MKNLFSIVSIMTAVLLTACGQPTSLKSTVGHDAAKQEIPRGPHKGKLFTQDGLSLEVTIFEDGVEPEFRVYPALNGKPLAPESVALTVTLERLGTTQVIRFAAKGDYLLGDQVVYEPHSFVVKLAARYQQKNIAFSYDQIEWRVELKPEQVKSAGLEILKSAPAILGDEVELQGEIRVAPDSETIVLAPVDAVVTSAPVVLGQEVKAGDVLATLESRELADLKRSYLEARERAHLAGRTLQRETQLWQEKITPEQDYLAARSAKAEADINVAGGRAGLMAYGVSKGDIDGLSLSKPGNLARMSLRAPRSGRITARALAPGQRVTAEMALFTIADLSRLVAVLSAAPTQLEGLQPGQVANLWQVSGTGTGTGRVQVVSAQLSESTRAAAIHVALDRATLWKPGQFVKARITRAAAPAAITVSSDALQSFRDWTVVYAKFGDQFEVRPVTVGRQSNQRAEILTGLSVGQEYVGKNSYLLKADLGKSEAEHDH